ncbi:hypothetical protein ACR2WG_26650, partial [Klebsiella pneumoniae]
VDERERGHFGHFIRRKVRKVVLGGVRIIFQTSGEVTVIFQTSGVLCVLKENLRGGQCILPKKIMGERRGGFST